MYFEAAFVKTFVLALLLFSRTSDPFSFLFRLLPPSRELAIPHFTRMAAPTAQLSPPASRRSSQSDFTMISSFTSSEDEWDTLAPSRGGSLDGETNMGSKGPLQRNSKDSMAGRNSVDSALTEYDLLHGNEPVQAHQEHQLVGSLARMQLHRVVAEILACREAMWDQLREILRTRPQELADLGWAFRGELDERLEREKYELLLQRFRT
jgi:hypothetical protein